MILHIKYLFKLFFFDLIKVNKKFFSNYKNKIVYIDIGGSSISNNYLIKHCNFLKYVIFEPDKRVTKNYQNLKNLDIYDFGLWSRDTIKDFNLYKNQISSSFYKVNWNQLKSYVVSNTNQPYELKKKIPTKLNKLDIISKYYQYIDFLKIDAEGAEIEILKGGKKVLKKVIGIQIEIQNIERYLKSAMSYDVIKYLNKKNYEIFIINKENWSRLNNFCNINSNFQCVWSDYVFFLNIETVIKNIKEIKNQNQKILYVKKIIFFMLLYNLHDSAKYYLDEIFKEKLIDIKNYNECYFLLKANLNSNLYIFIKNIIMIIFCICLFPAILFFYKDYIFLLKYCLSKLFRDLKRLVSILLNNNHVFRNTNIS
jgi:FkbM family methyltransferase